MVGAFFMLGEICFLCPFLRKEVSTVANKIMGITVEIGGDTTKLQTALKYLGAKSATIYNKQRVHGKSPLLEQHLDGDISNAYLAVNLRSIKAAKTAD